MIIKSLELKNFRNLEALKMEFSSGINILYGDNAQGKTNILEGIFVGSTTKSQRGAKDKELIKIGEDESFIRLGIEKENVGRRIDMQLRRSGKKGVLIDGQRIKKSSDLYGLVHVISFSPEDLMVIKNGPAERRRLIDMELCQLDKLYTQSLSKYNKVLEERNNLLKQLSSRPEFNDTLDIYDEQLSIYGTIVIEQRRKFIEALSVILMDKHALITDGAEKLVMEYSPCAGENEFIDKLKANRERDLYLKSTSVGPHRDDFNFIINGDNARNYGSQGQQRSVALSLKMAEIELVKEKIKESPVLLLDDVLSELDRNRQIRLLAEINQVQTFITCTGLEEFVETRKNYDKTFHISNGRYL